MMTDGPATEKTMCGTTAQKQRLFDSDMKDVAPMRFFFEEEAAPNSPVATKRNFDNYYFDRAPEKDFDNRKHFDVSMDDLDLTETMFSSDCGLFAPSTPEKRPQADNTMPRKPKLQLEIR